MLYVNGYANSDYFEDNKDSVELIFAYIAGDEKLSTKTIQNARRFVDECQLFPYIIGKHSEESDSVFIKFDTGDKDIVATVFAHSFNLTIE